MNNLDQILLEYKGVRASLEAVHRNLHRHPELPDSMPHPSKRVPARPTPAGPAPGTRMGTKSR